jgi:hypothetical protein
MDEEDPESKLESKNHLVHEWQLFWAGIVGDPEVTGDLSDPFVSGKLEALTLPQVREMTRVLSQDRKQLNQKLEFIQKQLGESNVAQGSSNTLESFSDQGQAIIQELEKLNEKLKWARRREDQLNTVSPLDEASQ